MPNLGKIVLTDLYRCEMDIPLGSGKLNIQHGIQKVIILVCFNVHYYNGKNQKNAIVSLLEHKDSTLCSKDSG